jgi:hypothetical protein
MSCEHLCKKELTEPRRITLRIGKVTFKPKGLQVTGIARWLRPGEKSEAVTQPRSPNRRFSDLHPHGDDSKFARFAESWAFSRSLFRQTDFVEVEQSDGHLLPLWWISKLRAAKVRPIPLKPNAGPPFAPGSDP